VLREQGKPQILLSRFPKTTATIITMNTSDNFVYVLSKEHSWVPAKLLEQDKVKATVSIPQFSSEQEIVSGQSTIVKSFVQQVVELKNYPNKSLPLQNVNETGEFKPVKDMVDVMFLHEVRKQRKKDKSGRKASKSRNGMVQHPQQPRESLVFSFFVGRKTRKPHWHVSPFFSLLLCACRVSGCIPAHCGFSGSFFCLVVPSMYVCIYV
jgi:hypothetical protein